MIEFALHAPSFFGGLILGVVITFVVILITATSD
jgi:hypothetical protein